MDHRTVTSSVHTIVAYVYANAAAREGATGFSAEDVGKVAYQVDQGTYWILSAVTPTWRVFGIPQNAYYPLVAGLQTSGSTYDLLGALPVLDYRALGVRSFTLRTAVHCPTSSTARVRLYDATHTAVVWESSVLSGPLSSFDVNQVDLAVPVGPTILEYWQSTPTITGGGSSCVTAGLVATF